jgi:hypothetical protein
MSNSSSLKITAMFITQRSGILEQYGLLYCSIRLLGSWALFGQMRHNQVMSPQMQGLEMIDSHARHHFRQVIYRFLACEISSDDFEEEALVLEDDSLDPCIKAIYGMLWQTYSEGTEKLTGQHGLTDSDKELYARCLLFLGSNIEYQWPDDKGAFTRGDCRLGPVVRVLTLGLSNIVDKAIEAQYREFDEQFRSHGDFDVWPFLTRADHDQEIARQIPKQT